MNSILEAERESLKLRLLVIAAIAGAVYTHQHEIRASLVPAVLLIVSYLAYALSLSVLIIPFVRTKYLVYGMIVVDAVFLLLAVEMAGGVKSNLFMLLPIFIIFYAIYQDYKTSFFAASVISASLVAYTVFSGPFEASDITGLVFQLPLFFLLAYFAGFIARRTALKRATDYWNSINPEDRRSPNDILNLAVASSLQHESQDPIMSAAPNGTVTILFSDIEGSTVMTETMGDLRWMDLLYEHDSVVRSQVAAHGGFEVKSQGDGFMLAFQSARRALLCAIDIQRAFAAYNQTHTDHNFRVRIGLHAGDAVTSAGDYYGKSVILASRIASTAQGGQILVSSMIKDLSESAGDICFRDKREVQLKGLTGLHSIYTVAWE